MAQWDVYVNPSPRARDDLPFVIDVQSDLLSGLATRLVLPFAPAPAGTPLPPGLPRRMSPRFDIAGHEVQLVPTEAGTVDASLLKRRVVSLRPEAHRIVDAYDAVISGV